MSWISEADVLRASAMLKEENEGVPPPRSIPLDEACRAQGLERVRRLLAEGERLDEGQLEHLAMHGQAAFLRVTFEGGCRPPVRTLKSLLQSAALYEHGPSRALDTCRCITAAIDAWGDEALTAQVAASCDKDVVQLLRGLGAHIPDDPKAPLIAYLAQWCRAHGVAADDARTERRAAKPRSDESTTIHSPTHSNLISFRCGVCIHSTRSIPPHSQPHRADPLARPAMPAAMSRLRWLVCLLLALHSCAPLASTSASDSSASASQAVNPSNPLRVSFPLVGASFDLRRLRDPAMNLAPGERHGFYNVLDTSFVTGIASANYSYVFNVGGMVPSPSREVCGSRSEAPVWQVKPPFSTEAGWKATGCARVANSPSDATWALLDQRDPSKGLTLTMLGGQECHSTKTNRTFTINFLCADPTPDPSVERMVNENPASRCSYEVDMITSYACPLECARTGGGVCAGGYCAFDAGLARPRCFCLQGMYGPDCTAGSASSTECTGVCLMMAFAVALLGVLLIVGGLAMWRLQQIVAKQRAMGLSRSKRSSAAQRDPQLSPDALSLSLDEEHSGNRHSGGNDALHRRGSEEREASAVSRSGGSDGTHGGLVQMHAYPDTQRQHLREIEVDEEEDLREL